MSFIKKLLVEDEQVVLHMHPHWKELIAPVLWFVVFGALGALGALALPSDWGDWVSIARIVVAGIAVVLIVWLSVGPYIKWATTHYVITTHRVALRSGILTRQGQDIPLGRITDVSFSQTIIERMFRLGTLTVQSASEQGPVDLVDMPKVEIVQSTLYRLMEEYRSRRVNPSEGY
ncbi:MAG: PH domain-containing protein [Stackebrandtia sp.]